MQTVKTEDGTITLFSEKYQEHYHSLVGAKSEAVEKFVKPVKIEKGESILDICFGLGYNALEAYKEGGIITSLEIDKNLLNNIRKINPEVQKLIEENKIEIIWGDARKTIKKLDNKFSVIFLDPFSRKKCPELWNFEFLENIKKVMLDNGRLVTYSCSREFRKNLELLGFKVEDTKPFGRKAPGTIAYLSK